MHVDDAGFVRAPLPTTYAVLTDVVGWPGWWSGTAVRPLGADHDRVAVRADARRVLRVRLAARGWRHDAGFVQDVTGDVAGTVEWWLEPTAGGVVVHHLATLRGGRRPLAAWRPWVRRGLWDLKDHLQEAVRARS